MALKGEWVRIHKVLLKADERTAKIPEDTKKCDLEMWEKGILQNDSAELGDLVTVCTATGRLSKGYLCETEPCYKHNYGDFIPEIVVIDEQLRTIMRGGTE